MTLRNQIREIWRNWLKGSTIKTPGFYTPMDIPPPTMPIYKVTTYEPVCTTGCRTAKCLKAQRATLKESRK